MDGYALWTASRVGRSCGFYDRVRYRHGLRLVGSPAKALRIGSALHEVLAQYRRTGDYDPNAALELLYGAESDVADPAEVFYVAGVARAYAEFWGPRLVDRYTAVATEKAWHMPAETQLPTAESGVVYPTVYAWGGVVDDVVQDRQSGECAIWETKTTSDDILPGGEFWLAVDLSWQDSLYQAAAEAGALGDLPGTLTHVIRDTVRKPNIRQKKAETPEEFGERAYTTMMAEPDSYLVQRPKRLLEPDKLVSDLRAMELKVWHLRRGARDTSSCVGRWGQTCPLLRMCAERLNEHEAVQAALDTDAFEALAWPHVEINPKEIGA